MVKVSDKPKNKKGVTVVRDYDIAADAKSRISLRGAKTKYFHVMVLSNGSFVLEPRVLVDPPGCDLSVRLLGLDLALPLGCAFGWGLAIGAVLVGGIAAGVVIAK